MTEQWVKELSKPFPTNEVHWRVGSRTKDKKKGKALAYIDARAVMDRLDGVFGPENWRDDYKEVGSGRVICTLSLRLGDEWVDKSDGAGSTDVEGDKGAISDAFKRAAVKWGIGRYLYHLDSPWVSLSDYGSIEGSEVDRLRKIIEKHTKEWSDGSTPAASAPKEETGPGKSSVSKGGKRGSSGSGKVHAKGPDKGAASSGSGGGEAPVSVAEGVGDGLEAGYSEGPDGNPTLRVPEEDGGLAVALAAWEEIVLPQCETLEALGSCWARNLKALDMLIEESDEASARIRASVRDWYKVTLDEEGTIEDLERHWSKISKKVNGLRTAAGEPAYGGMIDAFKARKAELKKEKK